ncbi:MAG: hypothetical protein Q7S65_01320 [Nanoarchaeota archaeon]|nr:hypothetical protein [Nanoarchaeota archaeon]
MSEEENYEEVPVPASKTEEDSFMKAEWGEESREEDIAIPEENAPEKRNAEVVQEASQTPEVKPFNTDKVMMIAGGIILLILLAVIFVPKLLQKAPLTLEELNQRNLEGKLKPAQGYVYNQHSFVKYDNLWYTSVVNPARTKEINLPFHFGPRDTEGITMVGQPNFTAFEQNRNVFITFDPKDDGLQYIGVAVGETDQVLINAFGKGVVAACTNNETYPCSERPTVTCEDKGVPVIYFATENETSVLFLDNCVIVAGKAEELWKATDRLLYYLLGIQ